MHRTALPYPTSNSMAYSAMFLNIFAFNHGTDTCPPRGSYDVTPFVDRRCKTPIENIQAAIDLIRTVQGFNKNSMTTIQTLSEIGGDMSVFPTTKHLVSWARCCPRNDQSAGKIKSTRISRAGSYFKPVLVQAASAMTKSKAHLGITGSYRRIIAHRGHKKAIIAIRRMPLTAIWHILSDLKPYTPDGYFEPQPATKQKTLRPHRLLIF